MNTLRQFTHTDPTFRSVTHPVFQRTWAEIHAQHLAHNYQYLRSLSPDSQFAGLCKANSYGHDNTLIAPLLEDLGADFLAVATIAEVHRLSPLVSTPFLLLGPCSDFTNMADISCHYTVHSLDYGLHLAQEAQEQGVVASIHLKIETGMHRLGFSLKKGDISPLLPLLQHPSLSVAGIFTHFCHADAPSLSEAVCYTRDQHQNLLEVVATLKDNGFSVPLVHCANSGATLYHPSTHHDMIRPGIALYGYDPSGILNPNLKPVLSLHSRITQLKSLPQGACIGYSRTHTLEQDTLVAVLPLGYGDGFPRSLSRRGWVSLYGIDCPILGSVCMDTMMIDVNSVKDFVQVGDMATVYGVDIQSTFSCTQEPLEHFATMVGSISYELLCNLSQRVPRVVVL